MKKIAVVLCGIEYSNQQELVQGMIQYQSEHGGSIHVFQCSGDHLQTGGYKRGAFKIFDLLNPQNYDGIILARETLHEKNMQRRVVERLRESGVPVISVGAKTEGMGCIEFDDYHAMSQMVRHVICEHGARKLAYIDGPKEYSDAAKRAQAYKDVLEEEGVPFDSHWFFKGDYSVEVGTYVVSELDRMHRIPEAIICANDCMAAGAIMELQNRGYRVPEDIIVTGFDNVPVAKDNSPKITTVDCARKTMGYRACEYLMTKTAKEIQELCVQIPTTQIYSESCGCESEGRDDGRELKRRLIRQTAKTKDYQKRMNEVFNSFMKSQKVKDFIQPVKEFVPGLGTECFYIAFRDTDAFARRMVRSYGEKEPLQDAAWNEAEKERYRLPIAYEKGVFSSYGELEPGMLLPKECTADENVVSFVMPIHYQEHFFGYCIIGYCDMVTEADLIKQWMLELGNAVESVLKKQILQNITEKLDRMSAFDGLTGLYNRVGFQIQADKYKMYAKSSGRSLYISFIDIDGLKKVNDTYGHHEGDWLIKAIAECLRKASREEEVCMRFGGDEFIVLGLENVADGRHLEFEQEFQNHIRQVNESQKREYPVSASIGSYTIDDVEHTNLQIVIERADMEMYLRKKKKKRG